MPFRNIPFFFIFFFFLLLLLLFSSTTAADICTTSDDAGSTEAQAGVALRLKLAALASILAGGALGVCIPVLGRAIPLLRPEGAFFFLVKAFAAGVILATGFVHILPGAFDALSSPCLDGRGPWRGFPFAGFGAMVAAVGTLMVDCFATGYFRHEHTKVVDGEENVRMRGNVGGERGVMAAVGAGVAEDANMHTHATHGHAHGPTAGLVEDGTGDMARHRIVAQILELGIVVHSVIIGVSLGASENPSTIRPLVAALTFHQLFEGMGLGGCITQAKLKVVQISVMALFFSLTTPMGIAIGIGLTSTYDQNSPTALVVEGLLESSAAGILIYMALVDLLAADFMNPKVQNNRKLQLGVNVFLLLGIGLMSFLATWV